LNATACGVDAFEMASTRKQALLRLLVLGVPLFVRYVIEQLGSS
jgi:hypothetical protein